jgi:hypothetical protein
MDEVHMMLALLVSGFILLAIGFSQREHDWSLWLTSLGLMSMFAPLGLRLYLGLG